MYLIKLLLWKFSLQVNRDHRFTVHRYSGITLIALQLCLYSRHNPARARTHTHTHTHTRRICIFLLLGMRHYLQLYALITNKNTHLSVITSFSFGETESLIMVVVDVMSGSNSASNSSNVFMDILM